MANLTQKAKKETGATFTPDKLADFLAEKLLQYSDLTEDKLKVLDPSCGDGALLRSISKKLIGINIAFEVLGYDLNLDFLNEASIDLQNILSQENISLINEDFLESIDVKPKAPELFASLSERTSINNSIDMVIANPPYVRTQILGSDYSQRIAEKFELKGRVDLYYPFLKAMTYALKTNGLLSVVTSNRYLTTKSGISVRKFLESNFEILEILDLGDTKLFDAAVLPAVFIGRKKSNADNQNSKFVKIYEEQENVDHVVELSKDVYDIISNNSDGYFEVEDKIFKKTSGKAFFTRTKESHWNLLTKAEEEWIDKVHQNSDSRISDHFKVRVGIKTTADKVFISDDWKSKNVIPERELLFDLISQQNIEPWSLSEEKKLRVLYPYKGNVEKKEAIELSKYPKAKEYLNDHYDKLSSRKYLIDAGREWFEIWVPHNPNTWKFPKLVFPDISPYPRFYLDESGKIVNGNCYWISAENNEQTDLLLLLQGICNSRLMTKYHDLMFNNKLYSGRRRYFSQFVEKYPLPKKNEGSYQSIIDLVKIINSSKVLDNKLIEKLESLISNAYGFSDVILD